MEKGEKVERKKRENSLVRDSGLNNKIIGMAAEKDESRAESKRKLWKQRQNEQKPKKTNLMDDGADTFKNDTIGGITSHSKRRSMIRECHFLSGQFQMEIQGRETVSYETTV